MSEEYCNNAEEFWKDITGYIGLYMVSNYGRIKSLIHRGKVNTNIVNNIIKEIQEKISNYQIIKKYNVSKQWINRIRQNPNKYLHRERILKLSKDKDGYLIVQLSKDNKKQLHKVHKLVLEAFKGRCPEGMQSCHNDGNPSNNLVENLRYDTPKANKEDTRKHGRLPNQKGSKNNCAKLNDWKVRVINRLLEDGYLTQKEIAKIFNVPRQIIGLIKNHKRWEHINF